jgi:D-alanyl-D-alanine carboxypeptidase (penicillin-binding protein 5/6)
MPSRLFRPFALLFARQVPRALALSLVLLGCWLGSAQAFSSVASQAFVVDLSTNTILYERRADEPMAPSSMTKIMTAYVTYRMAAIGEINLNDTVKVSKKAADKPGSTMFLVEGEKVAYRDLLTGLMIVSGNDAAIAIAEGVAGSEEAFAVLMNQAAGQLGMRNTHFVNASGWPDPGHMSTARDIALVSAALIQEFPEEYKMFQRRSFKWGGVEQANRNPLLDDNLGADGLKTGHTELGGYGLAGSAKQGTRRVVMVLNGMDSKLQRAKEGRRVMDWALRTFSTFAVVHENQIVEHARVWLGTKPYVPLKVSSGLTLTIRKADEHKLTAKVMYDGPVDAPIKAGDVVGELVISGPGLDTQRISLEAAYDIPQVNRFVAVTRSLRQSIWGDPLGTPEGIIR